MDYDEQPLSPCERYARLLRVLERELAELDRVGAHKAAAHLDAAIQQLRRDLSALTFASAAQPPEQPPPSQPAEQTAILGPFLPSFSEVSAGSQVFPRKANPANSR